MIGHGEYDSPVLRRLFIVLIAVVILVTFGTLGYMLIESWPVADSFFMTVITLSTVGYGETHDLSQDGRLFTSVLIFLCIVCVTSLTAVITSFIVENDISGRFAQKRMERMISELKGHTIVCGTTPLAMAVIERLMRKKVAVVVVDDNTENIERLKKKFRRIHTLEASASNELSLAKANILGAKNVVAVMEQEIDNLLIAITCRDLSDDIVVIAKSNDLTIANRMRKAGVNEIISPFQLGGERVSDLIAA